VLQQLRRTPEPTAQDAHWLAIMEEFQFTVQHRAGARNQNADALSRWPKHLQYEEITSVDSVTRAVRRGVEDDPDYRPTTDVYSPTRCPTSRKLKGATVSVVRNCLLLCLN